MRKRQKASESKSFIMEAIIVITFATTRALLVVFLILFFLICVVERGLILLGGLPILGLMYFSLMIEKKTKVFRKKRQLSFFSTPLISFNPLCFEHRKDLNEAKRLAKYKKTRAATHFLASYEINKNASHCLTVLLVASTMTEFYLCTTKGITALFIAITGFLIQLVAFLLWHSYCDTIVSPNYTLSANISSGQE